MNSAAEIGSLHLCVCVCVAVTDRASWEAAAKLMDAKEQNRKGGGEEGGSAGEAKWETTACTAVLQGR